MTGIREPQFRTESFLKRMNTMFRVDARRMFTTPLPWICVGISFAIPVLVLVMTSAVGGSDSGMMFSSVWQIIASEGAGSLSAMSTDGASTMNMTSMMNINLIYFMIAVFTCLFIAEDFRSGYTKNLFTVRAKKTDYVASKTMICFISGAMFLVAFFAGAIVGDSAAGLSFDLGSSNAASLVMCMLAKIFISLVFVAIFVLMGVLAKRRSWLSICLSLFGGMLLFMMVPVMTPLDSGAINVGMCLAGGAIFALVGGAFSSFILKRTSIV